MASVSCSRRSCPCVIASPKRVRCAPDPFRGLQRVAEGVRLVERCGVSRLLHALSGDGASEGIDSRRAGAERRRVCGDGAARGSGHRESAREPVARSPWSAVRRPQQRKTIMMRVTATMFALVVAAATAVSHAQGRGGGAWSTVGGDAQRTGWARTDPRISKDSAAKGLQLVWKRQIDKSAASLTQPVLLPNIISYRASRRSPFSAGRTRYTRSTTTSSHVLADAIEQRRQAARPRVCRRIDLGSRAPPRSRHRRLAAAGVAPRRLRHRRRRSAHAGAPGTPHRRGARSWCRGGGGGGGRWPWRRQQSLRGSSNGWCTRSTADGEDLNPPAKFTARRPTEWPVFIDNVVYAAVVSLAVA